MDNETCGLLTKKGEFIPLKGVVVQGYIIGRSARVSLSQHFKNEESKALEAVYKFPLPENSSICGFRAEMKSGFSCQPPFLHVTFLLV